MTEYDLGPFNSGYAVRRNRDLKKTKQFLIDCVKSVSSLIIRKDCLQGTVTQLLIKPGSIKITEDTFIPSPYGDSHWLNEGCFIRKI